MSKLTLPQLEPHLFAAHGFDPRAVFVDRDDRYLDFAPTLSDRAQIKILLDADPGMRAAFDRWWQARLQHRRRRGKPCSRSQSIPAHSGPFRPIRTKHRSIPA